MSSHFPNLWTRSHEYARVVEAERGFRLIDCNLTRDFGDIPVESTTDVVVIAEDEGLLYVNADSYDIASIAPRELICLLRFELVFEQKLLVICESRR